MADMQFYNVEDLYNTLGDLIKEGSGKLPVLLGAVIGPSTNRTLLCVNMNLENCVEFATKEDDRYLVLTGQLSKNFASFLNVSDNSWSTDPNAQSLEDVLNDVYGKIRALYETLDESIKKVISPELFFKEYIRYQIANPENRKPPQVGN